MPEEAFFLRLRMPKFLARREFQGFAKLLSMILFTGPMQLLTGRISLKCAVLMILMCIPSLLFCALMTLPAMIFQSPQQHVNYHFAQMLSQDPTRWIAFGLVTCCTVLSLAIPKMIDSD